MNPRLYDLSIAAGTLSCTAGAWLTGGTALALIVGGGLVLVLTVIGAALVRR